MWPKLRSHRTFLVCRKLTRCLVGFTSGCHRLHHIFLVTQNTEPKERPRATSFHLAESISNQRNRIWKHQFLLLHCYLLMIFAFRYFQLRLTTLKPNTYPEQSIKPITIIYNKLPSLYFPIHNNPFLHNLLRPQ